MNAFRPDQTGIQASALRNDTVSLSGAGTTAVRVQIPTGTPFGTAMNRIRIWLDANKIQPRNFRPVDGHGIVFELDFRSEHEAHLFHAAFAYLELPVGPRSSDRWQG